MAKDGASVETSHLYWPELSRARFFNLIHLCSLFAFVCGQKEYSKVFVLLMEEFCFRTWCYRVTTDLDSDPTLKLGLYLRNRVRILCVRPILYPRQSTLDCIGRGNGISEDNAKFNFSNRECYSSHWDTYASSFKSNIKFVRC